MPAVESLALGTPTLVSGIPVLKEVTLGKAEYLDDPMDLAEMSDRIASMIDHPDQSRPNTKTVELVQKTFAPKTIAKQYLRLLLD